MQKHIFKYHLLYIITQYLLFFGQESLYALDRPKLLNPNAPEYQCHLSVRDINNNREVSKCSGTYLSSKIFLTAAHCISEEDILIKEKYSYWVECYGYKPKKVLDIAVHPLYYINNPFKYDYKKERPYILDPLGHFPSTNSYNDIALLLTETIEIKQFPDLPNPRNQEFKYEENSCRFLGFSPNYCDLYSGSGCYRDNFSLKITNLDKNNNYICDMKTGRGCYLSNNFNDWSNMLSPLMVSLPDNGKEIAYKGDSGAGILCRNRRGHEVLAGVYVKISEHNVINLINKLGFIKSFKNLTVPEFQKKSQTIKLSTNYKKYLSAYMFIEKFIETFDYLPSARKVTLYKSSSEYFKVLEIIKDWIENDPEEFRNTFQNMKISLLIPFSSDKKWSWPWEDKVKYDSEEKSIVFDKSAQIDDFMNSLNP